MATLADELLNDFEDSSSEHEDESKEFANEDHNEQPSTNGLRHDRNENTPGMELANDEEEMEEAEEEEEARRAGVDTFEDEDDTKAKVEKMKLGGVSDVRNVAGLMKTLQPVLEVSYVPQLS